MFTMKDFNRIKKNIKGIDTESLFSPQQDELAHKISCLGSSGRGQSGEELMSLYLHRRKYKIKRFGTIHPFDILLDNKIKCEVKSATMYLDKKTYRYSFQGVKPELFDILFLVFVTPKGIVTKWTEQKYVMQYTANKKRQKDGYYIYFDGTCDNINMAYNDDITDFVKFYPPVSKSCKQKT